MKFYLYPRFWKLAAAILLNFWITCPAPAQTADTSRKSDVPVTRTGPSPAPVSRPAPPAPTGAPPTAVNKVSEIIDFAIDSIAADEDQAEKSVKNSVLSQNNEIKITITNPKDFLKSRPSDNTPLILYANGFPLRGMSSDFFSGIGTQYLNDQSKYWPDKITVPFAFTRDSTNEAAWIKMFKLTKWNKNKITVKMSLGWSGMFPLDVNAKVHNTVTVIFYRRGVFWLFSGIYLIFLILFARYCYTSGLIRDPDTVNNTPGPFSLAQTQLAFWTIIVIGGFSYLWLLTGQADTLNSSILLLLGISATTTGSATYIDYYKKTSLANSVASQPPAGPSPATAPNTIKQHRSFSKDILSDGVNMSVQRVQTALWNFVLGLYFLWYVVTDKSMPDFNNTLLVLAGVSSALYVTSKPAENPQTKPNPAPITNPGQSVAPNPADPSNSAQHEF